MTDKELLQKNVEEFSRLQSYMKLCEKDSEVYQAMRIRYVELKVILTASDVNLNELDVIKEQLFTPFSQLTHIFATNFPYTPYCKENKANENSEIKNANKTVSENKINETEKIVYIAKTGKKYQLENCRTLRGEKEAIDLNEAIKNGYEVCKICKPDGI